MEQIKKPNPYVAPGVIRTKLSISQVNRIVNAKGLEWLMENIVDTVCTVTEVAPEKVYSKSRLPAVSEAKLLIRFYMYETLLHLTSMNSMTEFLTKGRNDDHSIVLRSQKLVKVALEGRDEWAHKITEYVYKIDEQLNQIHVSDESNSSYRPRRKR